MDNARKNLKFMSIAMLVLAALSLIRLVLDVFLIDFSEVMFFEGITSEIMLVTQIVACVIGMILLVPQVYVGVKGMKIAKTPDSSKGHIVWATIMAVFSAVTLLYPVWTVIRAGSLATLNWSGVLDTVIDICIYVIYIQYAKEVLKNVK